jgi:hypothetical protein
VAYIRNFRGSSGNRAIISGSNVQVTGSLFASTVSGTTAQFTSITGNLQGNAATVTNGIYTTNINSNATTAVIAGSGLTGGGTTGSLTLNVGAGTGILVTADSVSINNTIVPRLDLSNIFTSDNTFNANILFGNGNGISFAATANSNGSMSTEILDDYEEGSWTPAYLTQTGIAPTTLPSYTKRQGHYTKIGNTVIAHGLIDIGTLGSLLTTDDVVLGGLPFSSDGFTTYDVSSININYHTNLATSVVWFSGYVIQGTSTIKLFHKTAASTTVQSTQYSELGSTSEIRFSVVYRTP